MQSIVLREKNPYPNPDEGYVIISYSQAFCLLWDLSTSNSFISSWDETGLLQVSFNGDMDSKLLYPPQSIRYKLTANRFIGIDSFHCLL